MPSGSKICRKLNEFVDAEYRNRYFEEVRTPNFYNMKHLKIAGYGEMLFRKITVRGVDGQELGIKLYNCPGHCVIFKSHARLVCELPLRLVDCNATLSNELNGAGYHKGDAHVFCCVSQMKEEVESIVEFCRFVYMTFGFTIEFELFKRPVGFYGYKGTWEKAENIIRDALDECCVPWKVIDECGAFSGPTVSAKVVDAFKTPYRTHIMQLDFNLPEHFDLSYATESGGESERPVLIHIDILGSIEEMTNILRLHYEGMWPFWLSPTQVVVYSISEVSYPCALQVQKEVSKHGYIVDVCVKDKKGQKVRESRVEEYNYKLVVGEDRDNPEQIKVYKRGSSDDRVMSVADVIAHLQAEKASFA